tara:strand:- start:423 stop:1049 length:627 start_codon:yes stop_codon:yes gene_type:complete
MDGLSAFDGIALVILVGSGLMALVRGFVREALSVTAFVAAALASLWARPVFIGLGREFIPNDLIANIAVLGVVFVLVFLAVSFVTGSLTKRTKEGEDVGVVDRALGFVFGLLRGLVFLGLLLIVFASANPGAQAPDWMRDARIYPLVNASARALQSLAPEDSRIARTPPISADDTAEPDRNEDGTAYDRRERDRLNDLINRAGEDDDE